MKHRTILAVLFIALALTACAPAAPAGPSIKVEEAWGRASPAMAEAGAFYMILRNSGGQADKLTGVKTSACGMVELHESFMNSDGTMGMRPVPAGYIEVPAGGAAELKPGGLHVMCMMKKADFAAGAKLPVTLLFETSGEIQIEAEIREN